MQSAIVEKAHFINYSLNYHKLATQRIPLNVLISNACLLFKCLPVMDFFVIMSNQYLSARV